MIDSFSLVIPSFNKFSLLKETINKILENFKEVEVIVVDDGSKDNTFKVKEIFKDKIIYLKNEINQGKGESLRKGFEKATKEFIIFTDDDLPYGIEGIKKILKEFEDEKIDIVIGKRKQFYNDVFYKKLLRPFLYLFLKIILGLNFSDTQCGLKGFKKESGKRLFRLSFIKGFAIDVEILYLAKKLNYKVKEVEVSQFDFSKSTFKLKGIILMFFDILKIKFHHYDFKKYQN